MILRQIYAMYKPALDAIGFQDRMCETLDWRSVKYNKDGSKTNGSIGKQPAWIDYMTNFNKSIESQIALNNAQASKINAETEKTERETEKTTAETTSVWSGIELLKARTSSEEAKIKLTNMQTELTEAMREESWSNWEKARAGVAEISRLMEKLDKEIEGMGFDNEIKNKSKEAIIGNYFDDLYRDWETDRKSTRLNSSHRSLSRMPSSA